MSTYQHTRQTTLNLCEGLTAEDMAAQSMPDASPVKWHLAHTTWFFETFLLKPHLSGYCEYSSHYEHLFNSYYQSVGVPYLRPQRGLLTRPSLEDILGYRAHVDRHMGELLALESTEFLRLTEVGLHHEMQHQELIMTDCLHLLAHNPTYPAIYPVAPTQPGPSSPLRWTENEGGMTQVGDDEQAFSYDCERPKHTTYLAPFAVANRLVTNAEWLAFMEDGGYQSSLLWLSDGWAEACRQKWESPLYWVKQEGTWCQFGWDGLQPINPHAPVCHVSFYEADAFARWSGGRLPREHELEKLLIDHHDDSDANLLEHRFFRPKPATTGALTQLKGDVWEWTQSPFTPYPKFKPEQGALGEYNGKFMANQMVLKGGSCVTPGLQLRPSYRNFFHPHQRWQFCGLRLAQDL